MASGLCMHKWGACPKMTRKPEEPVPHLCAEFASGRHVHMCAACSESP